MNVLLVNKFLYPNGGSETYLFEVGQELERKGNRVSYFGQANPNNIVGNSLQLESKGRIINPFDYIYSRDAYKKFLKLLSFERPDIVHLNNINFQLTPSIIYAARDCNVPVVWTIHDPQLVCPNHRLFIEHKMEVCTRCIHGSVKYCVKNKCFANSLLRSVIGYIESKKYYKSDIYGYVSRFICPSYFMANMLKNRFSEESITVLRNYCKFDKSNNTNKDDYILYYGRISEEKGIHTLLKAVPSNIKLKIAGKGPLENILTDLPENIEFVGFKTGDELKQLIQRAKFSIYPSEWYENCPFSIIESISFGTPVIGANIGGIPELIDDGRTGLLFEPGNVEDLREKISCLYNDKALLQKMIANTAVCSFVNLSQYVDQLTDLYHNVCNEKVDQ